MQFTSYIVWLFIGIFIGWLFSGEIDRIRVTRLDNGKTTTEEEVDQHGLPPRKPQQELNVAFSK